MNTLPFPRRNRSALSQVTILLPAACFLCAAVLFLPKTGPFDPDRRHAPTVFDTSMTILRDLVRRGDRQLGFRNSEAMNGAWIDTNFGISCYHAIEDSFTAVDGNGNSLAANDGLIDIHRTLYPVYGSDRFLHSAIEFDSTGKGLVPKEFDEGSVIRNIVQRIKSRGEPKSGVELVQAPFLHGSFFIFKDAYGVENAMLTQRELAELHVHTPIVGGSGTLPLSQLKQDVLAAELEPIPRPKR